MSTPHNTYQGETWADVFPGKLTAPDKVEREDRIKVFLVKRVQATLPGLCAALVDSYRKHKVEELTANFKRNEHLELNPAIITFRDAVTKLLQTADQVAVETFLENNDVDANFVSPFCRLTLLHYAVIFDNLPAIRALLKRGAKITQCFPRMLGSDKLTYSRLRVGDLVENVFTLGETKTNTSPVWLAVALDRRAALTEMMEFYFKDPQYDALELELLRPCVLSTYPHETMLTHMDAELAAKTHNVEAINLWHFALLDDHSTFDFLGKYFNLPFQDAVYLASYGDVRLSYRICEKVKMQCLRVVSNERLYGPLETCTVYWTFSACNYETLGLMGFNSANYGTRKNNRLTDQLFPAKHEDLSVLLTFLALPAKNAVERQAQLFFLQHALVALAYCNCNESPYPHRAQRVLIAALLTLGARVHGWSDMQVKLGRKLLDAEIERENPFMGPIVTFFHHTQDFLCEHVHRGEAAAYNAMAMRPLVLRLLKNPILSCVPKDQDDEAEDFILNVLWLYRDEAQPDIIEDCKIPAALVDIPVGATKNCLHDGPFCYNLQQEAIKRGEPVQDILTEGQSKVSLSFCRCPLDSETGVNPGVTKAAGLEIELRVMPKASSVAQLLEVVSQEYDYPFREVLWPGSGFRRVDAYLYLTAFGREGIITQFLAANRGKGHYTVPNAFGFTAVVPVHQVQHVGAGMMSVGHGGKRMDIVDFL